MKPKEKKRKIEKRKQRGPVGVELGREKERKKNCMGLNRVAYKRKKNKKNE